MRASLPLPPPTTRTSRRWASTHMTGEGHPTAATPDPRATLLLKVGRLSERPSQGQAPADPGVGAPPPSEPVPPAPRGTHAVFPTLKAQTSAASPPGEARPGPCVPAQPTAPADVPSHSSTRQAFLERQTPVTADLAVDPTGARALSAHGWCASGFFESLRCAFLVSGSKRPNKGPRRDGGVCRVTETWPAVRPASPPPTGTSLTPYV